jgi:hypothetical protein
MENLTQDFLLIYCCRVLLPYRSTFLGEPSAYALSLLLTSLLLYFFTSLYFHFSTALVWS